MVQGPAPDRLWPLVPVTAILASTSLLAYFVFRIYAAAVAQSTGRYQVCFKAFVTILFVNMIAHYLLARSRLVLHRC